MEENFSYQIIDVISKNIEDDLVPKVSAELTSPDSVSQNTLLSIIILTRNRKEELSRALLSCIECSLPLNTEFIIVDNGSTDGTQERADQFFIEHGTRCKYFYLTENIGVSAGRNLGFSQSNGRYVYFLDDDGYIDSPKETYFEKMIETLVENENIFCITTSIFDTELNGLRPPTATKKNYTGSLKDKVLFFHGGSCLIDKQRLPDQKRIFLTQQFRGMPELYTSLKNYFNGKYVIEMKDIQIIHQPSTSTRPSWREETIYHYTGSVHVKLIFYPVIFYPMVYTLFCLRIIKHIGFKSLPQAFRKLTQLNQNLVRETVSLNKFISFVRDFGFIAAF